METKTAKTLLLSGREDHPWSKHLRAAVEDLGMKLVIAGEATINDLPWDEYDLVILDAGATSNAPEAISQVLGRNPSALVVVFSSSPTWEQAREMFLAGAVDYAPKILEHARIHAVIKNVLSKQTQKRRKTD